MKLSRFLPLYVVASLTACSYQEVKYDTYFCFDTTVAMSIKTSNKTVFKELKNILSFYDKICDNYESQQIGFTDVSKRLSYTAFHYAFDILPSSPLLYSQSVS